MQAQLPQPFLPLHSMQPPAHAPGKHCHLMADFFSCLKLNLLNPMGFHKVCTCKKKTTKNNQKKSTTKNKKKTCLQTSNLKANKRATLTSFYPCVFVILVKMKVCLAHQGALYIIWGPIMHTLAHQRLFCCCSVCSSETVHLHA